MLTKHEIDKLNICLPSDYILLALEKSMVTEKSHHLRDRFNIDERLTGEELVGLPYSEHLGKIKITASEEIQWLTAFSVATGRDLQSIFEPDEYIYYTLFIDRKYINHQLKKLLDKYDLLYTFQTNPSVNITLSFPVKRN